MILTPIVYLYIYSMAALGALLIVARYLMVWTSGALIIWCMLGITSKAFADDSQWLLVYVKDNQMIESTMHPTRRDCVRKGVIRLKLELNNAEDPALNGFFCEVPKNLRTKLETPKCLSPAKECI